ARQQLIALGYTTTFQLSRANTDLVDTTGWSENNVYRVVAGVRGDFQAGGRDFNYEAYLNYGRTDFTDHQPKIDQQHFTNAINQCSTVPTVTGGGLGLPIADAACQPLNLFGQGVESPAALNYITRLATAQSRLQQFVGNANIGGSPFDLLGNPVSFNLGFEHHFEKGSFTPDAYLQGGLGRDVAIPATAGSYAMNEEFGEVLIPVITPNNNFVFSKLEAFGRFRHVDNSVNGAFDAWAVGGSFAPVPDIEFRGNFTRSFRTPSIVEFFSQPTTPFVGILDLCSSANQNAGPVPLTRGANCAAFNAKYPTGFFGTSGGVPSVLAGNPNLRNEVSNSFTYGVVLQPRFIPNLSVTVDYINIKISDPISSLGGTTGAATIAQGCIDNPAFNAADPANGNSWCSLIHRDPNGNVINNPRNPGVVASYVNGKRITMDAIQATLDYATSLSSLGMPGQFGLGATVFNLRNRLVDINGIAPTQSEGLVGDPKWQGQLRLRYADKAWGVTTSFNYTGTQAVAYTNRGANPNDIREFDHFDPYTTVDASIWFSTADAFRMTVAVTNLTNRVGQNYYGVIIPASINDALGRRFTASVSKHF
ncbi:MAG: TonB-dependent receptor, partial [Novosphingobium sp.]